MRSLPSASPSLSPRHTSVSTSLSTLLRPLYIGPLTNINTIWPLCVITLASMYLIITLPIFTPAAILIQFQLMRIITHSNKADNDNDDGDDDSDVDEEIASAKPPPSPLCIEVVVSESADSSPQKKLRELDQSLTQRSPQSPLSDDELVPLLAAQTAALPAPSIGTGSMFVPAECAAADIVHFDAAMPVDDDDDVVGHSSKPPFAPSRLWYSAIAAADWRFTSAHMFTAREHNTAVCV